ncbi:MAG: YbgA family protein [Desulfovibrio sp.]
MSSSQLVLGVSSCLLGNPVRYNGGHTRRRFVVDTLGPFVEYEAVCPEMESGMGVPRESMRLVGTCQDDAKLIGHKTGTDYTEQLTSWARMRVDELEKMPLCGFIFKAKSPSSGMERVKIYGDPSTHSIRYDGIGLFAKEFMERFPHLPVEDDGRLLDPVLRENFIQRIFTYRRWLDLLTENPTLGGLVEFHSRHKYLILSHHTESYRQLGKLVAAGKEYDQPELFNKYITLLLEALKVPVTLGQNTNTMLHAMGYFKKELTGEEKQELREVIDNYNDELVPPIVPMTLLKHFARKYNKDYLLNQYYLNQHPAELKLLNHV